MAIFLYYVRKEYLLAILHTSIVGQIAVRGLTLISTIEPGTPAIAIYVDFGPCYKKSHL